MSHYHRTTRECSLADLRPELAVAIRAHAQRLQWKDFESTLVACCETTTERSSTNSLDKWLHSSAPQLSHVALMATPDRLIWAYASDRAPAGAASALFKDMRLKLFMPKTSTGIAVDIYARMDGSGVKTGGRFMLEDGLAARHFCDEIKRATDLLRVPEDVKPRRKWFRRRSKDA